MTSATATSNPMSHSYSRLQSYTQCPLSFKLSYLDKVGSDDSGPMEMGAAAHEFFDRWVKEDAAFFATKTDQEREAAVLLKAASCFQKDARDQSNFKAVLEMCQTFAKAYKPDPDYVKSIPEMQIAFDRNWKRCDWFSRETYFRAKIDRIDEPVVDFDGRIRRVKVTDYKTGYAGTMDSFQLDVYAFVISLIYPDVRDVLVEFYYTQSGYKQTKLLEVGDMGTVKVQLEALMDRIEAEKKFKAKPGARCQNCGVAAFCDKKPSDLLVIAKLEDAEALATEVAMMDAQSKAKKKALNNFCKENGPVSAGGLTFSHWPKESMKVDLAPILKVCVAHNVDPNLIFNPDSTAIKKIIKKNPEFAVAIAPYVTIETGYSFYSKKSESDE